MRKLEQPRLLDRPDRRFPHLLLMRLAPLLQLAFLGFDRGHFRVQ